MKKAIIRTSGLISILLAMLFVMACNSTHYAFDNWDKNNNDQLNDEEFINNLETTNYIKEHDTNNDSIIDEEEFHQMVFGVWDENDNNEISKSEWKDGYQYFFENSGYNWEFNDWDIDGNNQITQDEFSDGFEDSRIFETWNLNRDEGLDYNEMAFGLYNTWDSNNNGFIEKDEFKENIELWGV